MSQKINDDMEVMGNITAESLNGQAAGKLKEELDAVERSVKESVTSEIEEKLNMLGEKLDVLIELIRQAGEKKEPEEVII